MLDRNSLAQLSQLKKDILATKDFAEGTVVGSNGRFGFVKLDDGRTAFLNPERMQRVLPGDRVKVNVVKNKKDQLEAELEKLLETLQQPFIGTYRVKGNNHFVESETVGTNRWLFVPPPLRRRCQEGDFVLAELNKHPYDDGKASVKINTRIGAKGDDYLQHNLVTAQFGLNRYWSKEAQQQTEDTARSVNLDDRNDFTHIPFVTIDAPTTRDMDDAIFAQPSDDGGWDLWVAIADPGHFILPGTPLAKAAKAFAQSVYLPGRSLPMLPETLSAEVFSLLAETEKPAMVAKIRVLADGTIDSYEFEYGKAKPRHKLTYSDVATYLDSDDTAGLADLTEVELDSLKQAYALAQCRFNYRQENFLTYDDQPDYDYQLNKQGFIESIQKRDRNSAHRLVEEAMLATNLCAGEFLAKHNTGVFLTHPGFRAERIGEVKALLREDMGEAFASDDILSLDGYKKLIKTIQSTPDYQALLAPLRRMMQVAEINTETLPHMSMGVPHYATITSPIRRYVDLCNHWSMIQILANKPVQKLPEKVLLQLQETLSKGRLACRQLELTLHGHYLKDRIGLEGEGIIRIVTQQGFGVRLVESGLEGFIQFSKKIDKTFDAKRMTLEVSGRKFALEQVVSVRVDAVDLEKRRVKMSIVGFSPSETTPKTEEQAGTALDNKASSEDNTAEPSAS